MPLVRIVARRRGPRRGGDAAQDGRGVQGRGAEGRAQGRGEEGGGPATGHDDGAGPGRPAEGRTRPGAGTGRCSSRARGRATGRPGGTGGRSTRSGGEDRVHPHGFALPARVRAGFIPGSGTGTRRSSRSRRSLATTTGGPRRGPATPRSRRAGWTSERARSPGRRQLGYEPGPNESHSPSPAGAENPLGFGTECEPNPKRHPLEPKLRGSLPQPSLPGRARARGERERSRDRLARSARAEVRFLRITRVAVAASVPAH